MEIKLYVTTSDADHINKVLTNEKSFDCVARDILQVVTPHIRISTSANLSVYNYAYIPMFGRYYYLGQPTISRTGLYDFDLRSDVLMSAKEDIKKEKAILRRQTNKANLYIQDPDYVQDATRMTQVKKFSGSLPEDNKYILVTAG